MPIKNLCGIDSDSSTPPSIKLPRIILASFILLVFAAGAAAICRAESSEIKVGSELDFRPYAFVDREGTPAGFSVDLIRATADAMGLRVQISTGSWDDVWNGLLSGRIDVLPIVATLGDRQQFVDFSLPHTETYDAFFVREGRPIFSDLESARGKEIVVMRSDAAHHALKQRRFDDRLVFVASIPEGLALVASGRHDAFLCSKLIGTLEIQEHRIKGLVSGPPLRDYKRTFSFAVRKGNQELLEKLNQGLRIIKANGDYDRIYNRWLAADDPWRRWEPYLRPAFITIAAFALMVLVAVLILQWLVKKRTRELARANEEIQELNRGLERRVDERTTELQIANASLRESHNQFFVLTQNLDVGVALIDEGGKFVIVNPAFLRIFDLPADADIRNVNDSDWAQWQVFDEDGALLDVDEHPVRKTALTGNPVRDRLVGVRSPSGGPIKWLLISAESLRAGDGRVNALICTYHDITARRQAEEALQEANASLEKKVEDRTEELARRAAQLRALAGELTLSEQRERSRLAKILHDHLQQLLVAAKFRIAILGRSEEETVKQGSQEVEELIDESIGTSRSLTAELSPPILNEAGLKAGLEWLAKRMADKQGLLVELQISDDGELPQDIKVLLFESVRELLFNVVKHAQTRVATVGVQRIGPQLQVIVSDQGIGFDPAAMPAVGIAGHGFGLFSIRERVELMGGTFSIESNAGRGSRFILSLSVEASTGLDTSESRDYVLQTEEPSKKPTLSDRQHRIRVMLADDHAVVRQGIANLIENEPDMEVVAEASNGQEAVELAAKLLPDVILMDLSMPKLNGVEATRIIHAERPDIRIIGLSMFDEDDRSKAMRDAGAVNYVTKSGPAKKLVQIIRKSVSADRTRS